MSCHDCTRLRGAVHYLGSELVEQRRRLRQHSRSHIADDVRDLAERLTQARADLEAHQADGHADTAPKRSLSGVLSHNPPGMGRKPRALRDGQEPCPVCGRTGVNGTT